jgi:hypothetical protein
VPLPSKTTVVQRIKYYIQAANTSPDVKEFLMRRLREEPFETEPEKPLEYAMDVLNQDPQDLDIREAKEALSEVNRFWKDMP